MASASSAGSPYGQKAGPVDALSSRSDLQWARDLNVGGRIHAPALPSAAPRKNSTSGSMAAAWTLSIVGGRTTVGTTRVVAWETSLGSREYAVVERDVPAAASPSKTMAAANPRTVLICRGRCRIHSGKGTWLVTAISSPSACTRLSARGGYAKPSPGNPAGTRAGLEPVSVHVQAIRPSAVRFHSQTGRSLPWRFWDGGEDGRAVHSGLSGRGSSIMVVMMCSRKMVEVRYQSLDSWLCCPTSSTIRSCWHSSHSTSNARLIIITGRKQLHAKS